MDLVALGARSIRQNESAMLTDFLLARIAEDEEGATPSEHWGDLSNWEHDVPVQFWDYGEVHIGHRRFLAECEAKRKIVESAPEPWENGEWGQWDLTMRILATVYSDHPAYRKDWKP